MFGDSKEDEGVGRGGYSKESVISLSERVSGSSSSPHSGRPSGSP